jgi:hypothetical protein
LLLHPASCEIGRSILRRWRGGQSLEFTLRGLGKAYTHFLEEKVHFLLQKSIITTFSLSQGKLTAALTFT